MRIDTPQPLLGHCPPPSVPLASPRDTSEEVTYVGTARVDQSCRRHVLRAAARVLHRAHVLAVGIGATPRALTGQHLPGDGRAEPCGRLCRGQAGQHDESGEEPHDGLLATFRVSHEPIRAIASITTRDAITARPDLLRTVLSVDAASLACHSHRSLPGVLFFAAYLAGTYID